MLCIPLFIAAFKRCPATPQASWHETPDSAAVNKPFPLFIATRYALTRRRVRFANLMTLTSIVGIALSVTAMVLVLSVMNGFEREVTRHLLGVSGHAIMVGRNRAAEPWPQTLARIEQMNGVAAATAYARGNAMLSTGPEVTGILLEGIEPTIESRATDISTYVQKEQLERLTAGSNNAIIGRALAERANLAPGDRVSLVIPRFDSRGQVQRPDYVRYQIVGLFDSGLHQFDSRLVLIHLEQAQALLGLGQAVSGYRLRFDDPRDAPGLSRSITTALEGDFQVLDWTQYQRNFFIAVQSQKRLLFVILILITAVAAFNIAANMIIASTEKSKDIAILRTLGATRAKIIKIFLLQGACIAVLGAALGVACGIVISLNSVEIATAIEQILGFDLINADVYFIDYLPTELRLADVVNIVAATLFLALLASAYPAYRAARVNPAIAVHQE